MPLSFFNSGRSVNQIRDRAKPAGYSRNMFLDASITSQLQSSGYILSPTSLNVEYVLTSFQAINKTMPGGKAIPAFQDSSGNVYIIDEKRIVYLLEKSKVNPGTGMVDKRGDPVSPVGDGGNIMVADYASPTGYTDRYGDPVSPIGSGPAPNQSISDIIKQPPPPIPSGAGLGSGKIYTAFNVEDVIPNQQEIVTHALWSNNVGNLTTFFTSSEQTTTQKEYYYEVYNSSSVDDCGAEAQFSVVYGNKVGSGSEDDGGQIEDTPSRAIYGQYRLLCLDQGEEYFSIDGTNVEDIYAINVNRARMKEYLDEGNIEINIAHLSGSEWIATDGNENAYTGSNVGLSGDGAVLRLIDDSSINSATVKQSGEVYNIVSGSIEDGVYNPSSPEIYGKLYKRKGIIVLSAPKLDLSASFGTSRVRELNADNAFKLFTAISGAANYTDGSGDTLGFQGRGAEKVKSTHYFVRAKNAEFNFSNNPTFITGSEGDLRHPSMVNNPKTYITTVGLYNYSKELVAVAKLSKPIEKSFIKEALIKVKLEFVWILGILSTLGMMLNNIL